MKLETITVFYNGSALLVSKAVAEQKNLKHGQRIKNEAEFWDVLSANASHMISICEHKMQHKDN